MKTITSYIAPMFLSLVILTVSADAHNLRHQLQRRQIPSACATPCAWLTPLSACDTTDLTCLCGIVNGAGANVNSCATCLQSFDPSIAADVQQVGQICPSTGAPPLTNPGSPTTGSSLTIGGTATTPPTATGTDCASLCDPIASAEVSCAAGDSCLCPTVIAAGPACSQCLLNVNATLASSVGAAISICNSEFPTATATGGVFAGACSSQCALINEALTACADESCFCTTLIGQGPACSQCFATVNVTEASILSGAIVTCQSLLPGVTGIPLSNSTQTSKLFPTAAPAPTRSSSQTVTLTAATSSSQSAGMSDFEVIFRGSFIQWITILALVGGVFGVFI